MKRTLLKIPGTRVVYHSHPAGYVIPAEVHDRDQILVVARGALEVRVGRKRAVVVRAPGVLRIPRGARHVLVARTAVRFTTTYQL